MSTSLELQMIECGVPEHDRDSLVRYIVQGIEPGSFLRAVLENDLMEACGRADHINRHALFALCTFLYNYAPRECHGSRELVESYMARKRGLEEARNG